MKAPWWVVLRASISALVFCVLLVLRVHSLPYPRRDGDQQLAKLVCFISASNEQYDYDSLRTGLCSHILLIDLMGVSKDGGLELLQPSSRALSLFGKLKKRFAEAGDEASFIISIGGVAQKSSHFSKALRTIDSRYALSDELMSFLIKHNLDGIDIAWFYPAQFGGVESDRARLVVFLEELYLRAKACGTLLSLTVGVDPKDIELSYDVPRINEVVDFVNLLTGDYHNPVAPNHISPLFGLEPKDRFNINYSVLSYIEAGLNPRKIVILNSCYAYLYVSRADRANPSSTKLKAVMRLSFLTAREVITRECFHTSWDDTRLVPYGTLTKGATKKWITYNDVESIRRKAEYVLHHQLGGIGLFSIDHDDFGGRAGYGRYPILRAMVYIIHPELFRLDSKSEESVETFQCPCVANGTATGVPEYACATITSDQSEVDTKQRNFHEEMLDDRAIGSCDEQSFEDVHVNQYVNLHDLQLQPNDRPPAPMSFMDPENYDSSLDVPFIETNNRRPVGIDRLEPSEMQPCASSNNRYMRRIDSQDDRRELFAASTGAPDYASKEEPMRQASNVRLQLLSTSNPLEGPPPPPPVYHQSLALQPLVRINPDLNPYSGPKTESPVVLITPKLSYTRRPSKRPNTNRRSKSRQRSNPGRSGRRSSTTTARPQHVSVPATVEQKTEPTTTTTATAAETVTILSTTTTKSAPVATTEAPCTVTPIPSDVTTTTPDEPTIDTTSTDQTVTSTEHQSVPETTALASTTENYSANATSA